MARSLGRRAVRLGLLTASRGGGMLGMRCLAILGLLLIQPGVATAQLTEDASEVPRLPWGAPDLQGVWDYRTATPLQRQRDLAAKERITGEEAAAYERQFAKAFGGGDLRSRPGTTEADVEIWFDVGLRLSSGRTSLIIDPPNGRLPALTETGRQRREAAPIRFSGKADGPEDRPWGERCLSPRVPFRLNPAGNYTQLFQTENHVAIYVEAVHDVRIVPLDRRLGLPGHVRQWLGSSRGYWDRDTLVVETSNFDPRVSFQGSGPSLQLVERFTRVDTDTLRYEYTVNDADSFTHPWTAMLTMTATDASVYEYACHEGNYSMENVLRGARALERVPQPTSR